MSGMYLLWGCTDCVYYIRDGSTVGVHWLCILYQGWIYCGGAPIVYIISAMDILWGCTDCVYYIRDGSTVVGALIVYIISGMDLLWGCTDCVFYIRDGSTVWNISIAVWNIPIVCMFYPHIFLGGHSVQLFKNSNISNITLLMILMYLSIKLPCPKFTLKAFFSLCYFINLWWFIFH